uniref:DUF4283 domain-containing protein n=1 Tax=Leersia perrieri TaxID=77586 RepID=A0A0D9XSI7_9ORYZ
MRESEAKLSRQALVLCITGNMPASNSRVVNRAVWAFPKGNFLMVCRSWDLRNRILADSPFTAEDIDFNVLPWSRRTQAESTKWRYKARICMEGIPAHAWSKETVAHLLDDGCLVQDIDDACLCVWVKTEDPDLIPRAVHLQLEETVLPPSPLLHYPDLGIEEPVPEFDYSLHSHSLKQAGVRSGPLSLSTSGRATPADGDQGDSQALSCQEQPGWVVSDVLQITQESAPDLMRDEAAILQIRPAAEGGEQQNQVFEKIPPPLITSPPRKGRKPGAIKTSPFRLSCGTDRKSERLGKKTAARTKVTTEERAQEVLMKKSGCVAADAQPDAEQPLSPEIIEAFSALVAGCGLGSEKKKNNAV